jgi:hypothetical protein
MKGHVAPLREENVAAFSNIKKARMFLPKLTGTKIKLETILLSRAKRRTDQHLGTLKHPAKHANRIGA